MKNILNIWGKSIELTDEQAEQLRGMFDLKPMTLAEVPIGETFSADGREYIVLEQMAGETVVMLKDFYRKGLKFGESNCYEGSYADAACCEFQQEICESIGEENIHEFDLDLTADDGLKDYGVIRRSAALRTAEMCRRYVDILDKYKPTDYEWLSTPHSTARHGNDLWVKCVAPSGFVSNGRDCYFIGGCGVRPFCIFDSSIFVSV